MKLTSAQSTINRFNRMRAWREFYPEGDGKSKPGYDLHHIDPTWRHNDVERYISWNKEDLVMLTHADHAYINQAKNDMSRCHTSEATKKMRMKMLGNKCAEGPHNISEDGRKRMGHWKGMKFREETCTKMSEARKGDKNPAFGRHWWHNSEGNRKFQAECPGPGWYQNK